VKIIKHTSILITFYKKAFNSVWCDAVPVPKGSSRIYNKINRETSILEEIWEDKDGRKYEVKSIIENPDKYIWESSIWSPKFGCLFSSTLENVEL